MTVKVIFFPPSLRDFCTSVFLPSRKVFFRLFLSNAAKLFWKGWGKKRKEIDKLGVHVVNSSFLLGKNYFHIAGEKFGTKRV